MALAGFAGGMARRFKLLGVQSAGRKECNRDDLKKGGQFGS